MSTLWDSVKDKLGVLAVTTVVSLATVFSDRLVGAIKEQVNKADQRPVQQERIAKDASEFIFCSENVAEFLSANMTSKTELHFVVDPYNVAIDSLRKNEYVYRAAVQRYWPTSAVDKFDAFYKSVRQVDASIHAFNPLTADVESGAKPKADPLKVAPLVPAASAALGGLEQSAKDLLTELSK